MKKKRNYRDSFIDHKNDIIHWALVGSLSVGVVFLAVNLLGEVI